MDESILTSIKKLLGISDEDTSFDMDIIIHINSVLSILTQVGIGPSDGFRITGSDEKWSNFLAEESKLKQQMTMSYVYLKVRLLFDPPNSSFVVESINKNIAELEWRLCITAD